MSSTDAHLPLCNRVVPFVAALARLASAASRTPGPSLTLFDLGSYLAKTSSRRLSLLGEH